jgi:hypothetical protein
LLMPRRAACVRLPVRCLFPVDGFAAISIFTAKMG